MNKKIPEKFVTAKKDEKHFKELSILHKELFKDLQVIQKDKHTLYETKYLLHSKVIA